MSDTFKRSEISYICNKCYKQYEKYTGQPCQQVIKSNETNHEEENSSDIDTYTFQEVCGGTIYKTVDTSTN